MLARCSVADTDTVPRPKHKIYSLALFILRARYHSADMFLNLLLAQQCLHEHNAGFFDARAGACHTVQRALPSTDITLHGVTDYVILPPIDLSGS